MTVGMALALWAATPKNVPTSASAATALTIPDRAITFFIFTPVLMDSALLMSRQDRTLLCTVSIFVPAGCSLPGEPESPEQSDVSTFESPPFASECLDLRRCRITRNAETQLLYFSFPLSNAALYL
jgi:hypothetical protein